MTLRASQIIFIAFFLSIVCMFPQQSVAAPADDSANGYMLATNPPALCPKDITGDALWPYPSHATRNLVAADNTGATDTTARLQKLMDCAYKSSVVLILPQGDYLISDTLKFFQNEPIGGSGRNSDFGGQIHGSTQGARPRIILKANSAGFNSPSQTAAKPMIKFTGGRARSNGSGGCEPNCLTLFPSDTYHMGIKNVELMTQAGNTGAVGINMPAAQHCFIEDVTINFAAGGFAGIDSAPGYAGYLSNIEFIGGQYGFYGVTGDFTDPYSTTVDPAIVPVYGRGKIGWPSLTNVVFRNQTTAAIFKPGGVTTGPFNLVGFEIIKDAAPAVVVSDVNGSNGAPENGDPKGNAGINLIDGVITIRNASNRPVIDNTAGKIVIVNNVYVENGTVLIQSHSRPAVAGGAGWKRITEYISPRPDSAAPGTPRGKVIDGTVQNNDTEIISISNAAGRPSDTIRREHATYQHKSADHYLVLSQNPAVSKVCNAKNPNDSYDIRGNWGTATVFNDLPGLQAMVNDPNCETVFLPKGDYFIAPTNATSNGLLLKSTTKLIGVVNFLSRLSASKNGARSVPEGWLPTDQVWIIDTPNDASATTQISHIGVNYPTGNATHDWFGALRWRAGKLSQVKAFEVSPSSPGANGTIDTKPRIHLLVTGNGGGKWYGLNSIKSKASVTGLVHKDSRRFLVENTTGQPLYIYNYNIEEGHQFFTDPVNGWASELRNARNISIFNSKFEGPNSVLIKNSNNIAYFGGGALEIGVRDSNNIFVGGIHLKLNPRDVFPTNRYIIQEYRNNIRTIALNLSEPLALFKRGTIDREAMRIIPREDVTPTVTPIETPTPTHTPTMTPAASPTVTVPSSPTPTPSSIPTATPTVSIPPDTCPRRIEGDATCNGVVDREDYACWETEYLTGEKQEICVVNDFDNQEGVTITDYIIWYRTYRSSQGSP